MMEIATYCYNKTSTIIQQLTLDSAVIQIPIEVHTPTTENTAFLLISTACF